MAEPSLLQQIFDPANRADPYPLYARLRQTPVLREADGSYVVSRYDDIVALLHDPRVSSDPRNRPAWADSPSLSAEGRGLPLTFLRLDPPEHDRLRRQAMHSFGPPHRPEFVASLRSWLLDATTSLIDAQAGKRRIDLVEALAYPLPVAAICRILGVPPEDEPRFHAWSTELISTVDPSTGTFEERQARNRHAIGEVAQYLGALAFSRVGKGGDDLLSRLLTDSGPDGPMAREDAIGTGVLLLVAGHETTVNLLGSGMLTLLRHPEALERLRDEPALVVPLVEELLRYEPPVQMLPDRVALDDIEVAGVTIPRGSTIVLALAAGNRDPDRFTSPDSFVPDRANNQHLGFASGIHYCFGAPLARMEAHVALTEFARRFERPRLVNDPPPYRPNATLRGPQQLLVEVEGIR